MDEQGHYDPFTASPSHRVVSPDTADVVSSMLPTSASMGRERAARIEGYQVDGNTGNGANLLRGSRRLLA